MSQALKTNSNFNKHLFRAALECPTKLFYKANNYPESHEALPFIVHNNINRSQFKALVRNLYPQGTYINEGSVKKAFKETSDGLLKEETVLFDTVFIWQDILAKLPIVEKKGNTVNVFYIQTKAFNPHKHRLTNHQGIIYPKWKDYLTDFAFQLYVVRQLYPRWELTPLLVLPDKTETAKKDQLYEEIKVSDKEIAEFDKSVPGGEELVVKLDVSNLIKTIWEGKAFGGTSFEGRTFSQVLVELKDLYFSGEKYPVTVGSKCKNCEFRLAAGQSEVGKKNGFRECWEQETGKNSEFTRGMVFDLIGPGTNHWIERELYFQHQVPPEEVAAVKEIESKKGRITERQRQALQILKTKGLDVPNEIIKPQLYEELERWEYPVHFLDFEAGSYIIPIKNNRKPYHLVVFQYSCHSLYQDGHWNHHEWIDDLNNGYSNYECVRQLCKVPGLQEGTIVQYSGFERNALKIIRKELLQESDGIPDAGKLIEWIESIVFRHDSNGAQGPYLADLSRMVRNYYYNSEMGNSLSIKDVVQSVLTESPYLKQIYREPYSSSNFDSVVWWQPEENEDVARSPYSIMMDQQDKTTVRRGTEAMVVYGNLLSNTVSEAEKTDRINSLLKYCELDTLAMLMIFQHWQALLKKNKSSGFSDA